MASMQIFVYSLSGLVVISLPFGINKGNDNLPFKQLFRVYKQFVIQVIEFETIN